MVTRIADGVWWIRCSGVNAYVLEGPAGPVLVDAGTALDGGAVEEGLAEAGHEPADLAAVLLTHHDPDHVGGLDALGPRPKTPVRVHRLDRGPLTGEDPLPLTRWKGLLQRVGGLLTPGLDLEVVELRDGDVVAGLEVLHTPGHTPGHVAYLDRDRGLVLAGDLVWAPFGRLRLMPGVADDDPDLSKASLGSLVHRLPEAVEVVAPGHGRPVTDDGFEALSRLADEA